MSGSSNKRPTPLDFDRFVPWLLAEMENCMAVRVNKVKQVEYGSKEKVKHSSLKLRHVQFSNETSELGVSNYSENSESFNTFGINKTLRDKVVKITAYYDNGGRLTEIAFVDRPLPIQRQLFKVIALCLPFHAQLTKLTFKGDNLNCGIIYEIAKLLPFSHLTDICLDHSYVPQGNYYILLDQATTLRYLSLSDCKICDVVCKEIAVRIESFRPASKNLLVLNLSNNNITQLGAEALGHSLRTNRHLLHLNLCNNNLTSVGAAHILSPLSEFMLNPDEISNMKRKRFEYIQQKEATVRASLKEVTLSTEKTSLTSPRGPKPIKSLHERKKSYKHANCTVELDNELSDQEPLKVLESHEGIFHPSITVLRAGAWYCNGNFTLCSLNLAYNNLDFSSVEKIIDVLEYQYHQDKSPHKGLLRLVLDGNRLPVWCVEYEIIKKYLNDTLPPEKAVKKRMTSSKERGRSQNTSNIKLM